MAKARPNKKRRRPTDDVRLEDPGALRALAHPARLRVVDELYQGSERTASELAKITGLTPSAMSYHLRALERWGIVERGDARQDGRERPWRAAGRSVTWAAEMSVAAAASQELIAAEVFEQLRDAFRRWSAVEPAESGLWREVASLNRSFMWLTDEEAQEFLSEVDEAVQKRTRGRDAENHPEGTRRVLYLLAFVPTVDEPTTPQG
jgi:DNA-binding transcriptional ArsR family regulator